MPSPPPIPREVLALPDDQQAPFLAIRREYQALAARNAYLIRRFLRILSTALAVMVLILAATGVLSWLAFRGVAQEPAQIQQSRYRSTLQSCQDTNERNRKTFKALKKFPPPRTPAARAAASASKQATLALLNDLNPVRKCRMYAAKITRLR